MRQRKTTSLKNYNTFGLPAHAREIIEVQSREDLITVLRRAYSSELFIIGGGSNMLLAGDIDKRVLHINNKGIEIVKEEEEFVNIRCQAGENWHQFVSWCVQHDFGGLENLALIPGKVGASPIQNIGAYGVELKDSFVECEAVNMETSAVEHFSKADCQFGYRDSVFKNELKGRFIILSVTFKLTKKKHRLQLDYGSILEELQKEGVQKPGISDVFKVVIKIREDKLPDPQSIGNCGSFFKNPVLSAEQFKNLIAQHPDIKHYKLDSGQVKVPAGWLIDQSGFKGYQKGMAGVHKKQALVLINLGEAKGDEVIGLARDIQQHILKKYGIKLHPEVNIYPEEKARLLS